tara:strand:+ start:448 stop:687 length:240 start_codon:yes stop_codon:yes gene_type:complete
MKGKKVKLSNKLQKELEKQNVRFVQKTNNFLVVPPDPNAPAYTWHKSDQHLVALVEFIRKRWSHVLDLSKLRKVHKSFG